MVVGTAQASRNVITLKGSTALVTEFFDYAINNILYQRGLYPPDMFETVTKYGLSILKTNDKQVVGYLKSVLDQLQGWLVSGSVQKLALVVLSVATKEPLERWEFDIRTDLPKSTDGGDDKAAEPVRKDHKAIVREIRAVMLQITGSVSMLPLFEEETTFDILIYTDAGAPTPIQWEESDAKKINNAEVVTLRSFSTKIHSVEACVTYKREDSDEEMSE